jgi:hypothetical protein
MPITALRQTTLHLYLQCSPYNCPSIFSCTSYITLCVSEWVSDVLINGEDVLKPKKQLSMKHTTKYCFL